MSKDKYPLDDLVQVMATLRGEGGCPWDREQNHDSIKKYLVEETYEVIEAIEEKNMHKLCDELGDLLLQIVFHAQMASEKGDFDINNVIKGVTEKMIRRHPHVFAGGHAENSEEVLVKWEEIKAEEQNRPKRLLEVPRGLPALHRAQKIQEKAARVGFDWPSMEGAWEKITEEMVELQKAIKTGTGEKEELGDLLFAVVNVARFLHVDAEEALRETMDKFNKRFSYIEDHAKVVGRDIKDLSLTEMDQLWDEAKENLF
ncbi:MAG: nucleoside triphosphate pyrophosphohydrolase [Bacillota bacterium]